MGCILSTKFNRHPTKHSPTTASAATVAVVPPDLTTFRRSPGDPVGWPPWLMTFAGEALAGLIPRRADSFKKLSKVLVYLQKFTEENSVVVDPQFSDSVLEMILLFL